MHDPLLAARRDTLQILIDALSDEEYAMAIKVIDMYIDALEGEIGEEYRLYVRNATGKLILTVHKHDSNSQ